MIMTKFSRINKQREEITMRVLEDMEKGGNEWKKPWVEASPLPPHNPVSGTQYSGRNFLYTYVYGMMRGYADPRWATEKQIKEMGWKIPENLQNGRGGINDELGVGIEHWGMYAYIPRVKKDGTPLTDKGGTQKFTRVRAVKENGVWGRYRKGDNGKYEFEQLPSGVHPHPECDRYFKVFNLSLIEGIRQPARRSCRSSICPKRQSRKTAATAVSRTRRKRLATRLPTYRATAQTL